jgi:hypothetical protein
MLSIMPFLALAREVAALFAPVAPRPEFRSDLERVLVAQARQQAAHAALIPVGIETGERRWVKGAAAAAAVGSAVSLAGIVVYVLRRRDRVA